MAAKWTTRHRLCQFTFDCAGLKEHSAPACWAPSKRGWDTIWRSPAISAWWSGFRARPARPWACAPWRPCGTLPSKSHLVVSKAAVPTLAQETGLSLAEVQAKADVTHKVGDVGAAIASGSFRTLGMIVAPCSVRTMSEIATGVTSSPADPRRRRDPEGAPAAGADGARDAAAPGPPAHHGQAGRDGRDHRPAAAGLLRQARRAWPRWSTSRWAARSTCSAWPGSPVKRWGEDIGPTGAHGDGCGVGWRLRQWCSRRSA